MNILHNGAITLHHGDCLDVMHEIPDGSVDAIICDLPYGTTACKWDVVIPFEPMWIHLKRIIKPRGAIVLFGSQPFTSALVMSNVKMFKYQWVWDKVSKGDIMNAKNKPMKRHEDICIFSGGTTANRSHRKMSYYPQGVRVNTRSPNNQNRHDSAFKGLRPSHANSYVRQGTGYPDSILTFSNANHIDRLHPTQKPLALLEYLIRTYTNEGETVLDFTFGSCTAGVAALTTKRRFIGIERDDTYYALGVQRVQTAIDNLPPMDV